jgi:protein-disulfide isomerase
VLGTEPKIREKYIKTGQVVLIFAPVLNHLDLSDQTHQAAECAADQGRFWEFHDILFENQDILYASDDIQTSLKQLAAGAGFNTGEFNVCLDEQRHLELIQAQDQVRQKAGIRGQPVFYINGDFLVGAQPYELFEQTIEAKLAELAK